MGTAMTRAHYTVLKRNGRWGICACGAPFFECESYQEALEVSVTAASILARGRWLYGSGDLPNPSDTEPKQVAVAADPGRGEWVPLANAQEAHRFGDA